MLAYTHTHKRRLTVVCVYVGELAITRTCISVCLFLLPLRPSGSKTLQATKTITTMAKQVQSAKPTQPVPLALSHSLSLSNTQAHLLLPHSPFSLAPIDATAWSGLLLLLQSSCVDPIAK